MDCKSFHTLLSAYVHGRLDPNRFKQMVAHEAECEACHRAACEAMDVQSLGSHPAGDTGPPGATTAPGSEPPGAPGADAASLAENEAWVRDTLSKTVGADCTYIELQLAATLDAARPLELPGLIKQHLASCEHCRAVAGTLRSLPDYYAALPRLRADAGFAREVVERTWGPKAGFREVLRALLARPSLMWEGAVVCALLLTPLAGNTTTKIMQSIFTAGSAAQEQVVNSEIRPDVTQQVAGFGERLSSFQENQTRAIQQEWHAARDKFESSLEGLVGERLGENASVALVRSLARHALGTLGVMEEDPVPVDRSPDASPRISEPPAAIDRTPAGTDTSANKVSPVDRSGLPNGESHASPAKEPSPEPDTSEGGSQ